MVANDVGISLIMNNAPIIFTGEQHSEIFEQIFHLAEEQDYSVRVYESKVSSQFDFLLTVYRDTAIKVLSGNKNSNKMLIQYDKRTIRKTL